ncbi:MAG: transglutaminase domain-containing protein [Defluviitaleaceae bacterium]|nr:transglutaminase domain-containing protein [Defluviitaleaceae bacterium]
MTDNHEQTAPLKHTRGDYIFCIIVGSLYMFAINRAIITSTFITIPPEQMFLFGIVSIIVFLLILYNRITRIASLVILLIATAFFVFWVGLSNMYYQFPHLHDLFLMVSGQIPYRSDLGVTLVWVISLLLAFVVVVFMFHQFNFYILAAGGIGAIGIPWIAGFSRDELSFLIFLLSFLLLFIRKNNKNMVTAAAPVCLFLIIGVQLFLPSENDFFQGRRINDATSAVGDFFFELFTPTYFSFQSTGFSGAGGVLGGPVTPNNRSVMTVRAPGRTYLAGATSNTYTGDRWISTLSHDDINTHGLAPGHFEQMETAAALMRGATFIDDTHSTVQNMALLGLNALALDISDTRHMHVGHFATLGATLPHFAGTYYMHTYLPVENMTIVMGTNRTGTIFRPNRMSLLWFYAGSADYARVAAVSPTGDIRTPSFMSHGTTYHMQFLDVNTQLSFIEDILRHTNEGVYVIRGGELDEQPSRPTFGNRENPDLQFVSEALWFNQFPAPITILETDEFGMEEMNLLFEFFFHGESLGGGRGMTHNYILNESQLIAWLDIFSYEILTAYARQVREHFMYVPDITPQRVWDLTESIVEGHTNDFDRVMAIRDFLLQFPYTLSPAPVPRGVCFVDHFLFDGQEGYCTYFASAMAVMARMAGVPSRYVEGFVLPPSAGNEATTVTNRMAHAWVEVYLEGFGWKIVEATPTYAFLMNPDIVMPPTIDLNIDWSNGWQDMLHDWDFDLYEMEQMMQASGATAGAAGTSGAETIETRTTITAGHIILALIGAVMFMLVGFILFIWARRWYIAYKLRSVKSLAPNAQIKVYFAGIMDIVGFHTKPLSSGETPLAYSTHMGKRFAFQNDSVFLRDIIALYYKAKYSAHEATQDEVALMEEAYHDMVRLLAQTRRQSQFVYLRYVKLLGMVLR